MNKPIFRCQFGSHVYGTNIPTSDLDFKSLFVPDPRAMILQRAAKHIQNNTKKDSTTRNLPTDIDDEAFSVQNFLRLLCEGQTVALDMIFTPESFWLITSDTWRLILSHKKSFLHKGTASFVGYTRTQAAKYGVKGFRVAALRDVLTFLKKCLPSKPLHSYSEDLGWFVAEKEHIGIIVKKDPSGKEEAYLEVCNRKVPFHATVKYATEIYQRIFDQYGQRAMMAEKNEGIDWKALMHAVRVAREAEELLLTAHITFPRPEKELLIKIRTGQMDYNAVAPIIEEGLLRIDEAQQKSILPEEPDYKIVDQLVYSIYRNTIFDHLHSTMAA